VIRQNKLRHARYRLSPNADDRRSKILLNARRASYYMRACNIIVIDRCVAQKSCSRLKRWIFWKDAAYSVVEIEFRAGKREGNELRLLNSHLQSNQQFITSSYIPTRAIDQPHSSRCAKTIALAVMMISLRFGETRSDLLGCAAKIEIYFIYLYIKLIRNVTREPGEKRVAPISRTPPP